MPRTQKVRLIAVATAFVALSLPGSSSAQFATIGTWTGYESFETSVFDFSGNLINSYSGSGPGGLSIGINDMEIGGASLHLIGIGPFNPPDPFGPTSASAFIRGYFGPGGSESGDFFVTYESILPNGQIDVGNGTAIADLTTIEYDFSRPIWTVTETFATFTTLAAVPEPPSSVLAGLAILVVAAVAWIRGFRRRLQARLS
jgi:hypothetical protein